MGEVRKYGKHKRWTEEEIDLLCRLSDNTPQTAIARQLGRSVKSVKCKRISMGIECYSDQRDKLCITEIAELTGLDKGTIGKTWRKYGLRFRNGGTIRVISENTLVDFMKKNPQLWKASRCDYHFFAKYKWFIERLQAERDGIDVCTHYMNKREWTDYEISRLQMLKKRGLTHKEIAQELGRTKRAIDHASMKLNRSAANVI